MELRYYPDPALTRRAEAVDPRRKELKKLVKGMIAVMRENRGVGLAAPQVGEGLRIFVVSESGEEKDVVVCVNPRIETSGARVELEEGCLS
ncbi:MAG: peptide deformylase, partial [Planctomycetota bacterium]